MSWLAVAVGGAIGSLARHGVNIAVHRAIGDTVPYATALVNVLGCIAIGLLAGLVTSGAMRLGETGRMFLFVGLLGGFTTFSSFGLDTFTLLRSGAVTMALINVAVQVCVGLAGVIAGYWLSTAL